MPLRSKPKRHGAEGSGQDHVPRVPRSRQSDGRYWIRQNCFKCGGKLQYACAIEPPGGDLRAHVFEGLEGLEGTRKNETDETDETDDLTLALRGFGMDLCVVIDGASRSLDGAFADE